MEDRKPASRLLAVCACAALLCFLCAGGLLLLRNSRSAPVFAEFSESSALDGKADCYVNELTVLDRYAEQSGKDPAELLLASYADRDDKTVVLSLLVEADDPLRERLEPYFEEETEAEDLAVLSGYFFTRSLRRVGEGAEAAFCADAEAFSEWRVQNGGEPVVSVPVVLIFAGADETAYLETVRTKGKGLLYAAIGCAALGLLSAAAIPVRILARRKRTDKR